MKVLTILLSNFLLPNDFNGRFSDALRLLADYHDEVKNTPKQKIECSVNVSKNISLEDAYNKAWNDFWKHIDENRKFSGCVMISELTNNKMNEMPDFLTK